MNLNSPEWHAYKRADEAWQAEGVRVYGADLWNGRGAASGYRLQSFENGRRPGAKGELCTLYALRETAYNLAREA